MTSHSILCLAILSLNTLEIQVPGLNSHLRCVGWPQITLCRRPTDDFPSNRTSSRLSFIGFPRVFVVGPFETSPSGGCPTAPLRTSALSLWAKSRSLCLRELDVHSPIRHTFPHVLLAF